MKQVSTIVAFMVFWIFSHVGVAQTDTMFNNTNQKRDSSGGNSNSNYNSGGGTNTNNYVSPDSYKNSSGTDSPIQTDSTTKNTGKDVDRKKKPVATKPKPKK